MHYLAAIANNMHPDEIEEIEGYDTEAEADAIELKVNQLLDRDYERELEQEAGKE